MCPKHLELEPLQQNVRRDGSGGAARDTQPVPLSSTRVFAFPPAKGGHFGLGRGHGDCVFISNQLGSTLVRAVWLLVQTSGPEIPPRTESPHNSHRADFGELCPRESNVIKAT